MRVGKSWPLAYWSPAGKLDAIIGDTDELSEVVWAGFDEAVELLPGMYEPVLNHIRRELGHNGKTKK